MQCHLNPFQKIPLEPIGNIILTLINKVDDIRETNICLGLSVSFGYLTSTSCCEAENMVIFDLENSIDMTMDEINVWTENQICFINTTEEFEFNISIPSIKTIQNCSIIMYDHSENRFNDHHIEIEIDDCVESPCLLELNPSLINNQSILNGTMFICEQSYLFGIITKSKSRSITYWTCKLYYSIIIEICVTLS